MKRKYCIFGCSELGAYMHRFPHPERRPEQFKAWLAIVGNKITERDPLKIYNNKKICDYHFKPEHKVMNHRLSNCAVPCLHLSAPLDEYTDQVTIYIAGFVARKVIRKVIAQCVKS